MGSEMSLFGKEKEHASSKRNPAEESKWGFASFVNQHEGKKVKKARKVYGLWGAMKYTMILSLLLWWLPVFGQMIAGYVGGRKAGSPMKAVIAAVLPVVALFIAMTALDHFLVQSFIGSGSASSSLIAGFATSLPIIGPYLDFTRNYVMSFIDSLSGSAPYGMNSYIITLAFAYIGGILADQTRREIEAVSGAAGSHTMVVVAPNERADVGHGKAAAHHNPVPLVGSIISGKMSSLKHPHMIRKRGATSNFDGMVAIRDLEGAEEEDEIEVAAPAAAHGRKHMVRKVRKLKAPPVIRVQKTTPMRHERANAIVSASQPNTCRAIQRKIEKEWDPARKMRAAGTPPIMIQKHHVRGDPNGMQAQVHSNVIRRPPTRSWDTI
jgi:hypothetical protein